MRETEREGASVLTVCYSGRRDNGGVTRQRRLVQLTGPICKQTAMTVSAAQGNRNHDDTTLL